MNLIAISIENCDLIDQEILRYNLKIEIILLSSIDQPINYSQISVLGDDLGRMMSESKFFCYVMYSLWVGLVHYLVKVLILQGGSVMWGLLRKNNSVQVQFFRTELSLRFVSRKNWQAKLSIPLYNNPYNTDDLHIFF
jgi:hypothetical protein